VTVIYFLLVKLIKFFSLSFFILLPVIVNKDIQNVVIMTYNQQAKPRRWRNTPFTSYIKISAVNLCMYFIEISELCCHQIKVHKVLTSQLLYKSTFTYLPTRPWRCVLSGREESVR